MAGPGGGGGDRAGEGERAAVHDHRERCDGEGGGVLSDDGEEGVAGADDCAGEPDSDAVSGGLGGVFLPLQEDVFPDTG